MKKILPHLAILLLLPSALCIGCATGYTVVRSVTYRTVHLPDNGSSAFGRAGDGYVSASASADEKDRERTLAMDIYLPEPFDRNTQYAGVLFLYGCAWNEQSFFFSPRNWKSHAVELARKGYISFAIDYRVAPNFYYPAPNEDAQYALDLITGRKNPAFIQPFCRPVQDVAVVGFSSGGNIAALMGTGRSGHNPAHVRCIAIYAGLMDVRKKVVLPEKTRHAVDTHYLAGKTAEVYREASPLYHVDKAFCPFLFQAGRNDSWMSRAQIDQMYAALRARGIPAETYLYDNGPHGFQFWDTENGKTARSRTIAFISRYLPAPH